MIFHAEKESPDRQQTHNMNSLGERVLRKKITLSRGIEQFIEYAFADAGSHCPHRFRSGKFRQAFPRPRFSGGMS